MQVHTLIIGTSKSKNQNGYYIDAKEKFWGLVHKGGASTRILDPTEFQTLIQEHGIGFSELAFNHIHFGEHEVDPYTHDEQLKNDISVIREGTPLLMKHLQSIQPKRIVFNGKSAAGAFLQQKEMGMIQELSAKYINQKGLNYGHIGQWEGIDLFMLPSLSAAAGKSWKEDQGEDKWLNFWRSISKDCHASKPKWIWIALFLLTLATILIITKK